MKRIVVLPRNLFTVCANASAVSRSKRLIGKRPANWTGASFVRFRSEALDLVRSRWHVLTIATLANQLADFGLMIVALRATGITRAEVDIVEAFAAWALVRALGVLPITPGGIGIVELALTGALAGFGASGPEAVAATLAYRSTQIVPVLALGLLSAATWKIGKPTAASTAAHTPELRIHPALAEPPHGPLTEKHWSAALAAAIIAFPFRAILETQTASCSASPASRREAPGRRVASRRCERALTGECPRALRR